MRSLKIGLIVAGVSVLALGACNKKADEAAKTETAAAPGAAAPATDGPLRHKAGFWQQLVTIDGVATPTPKVCLDDALSAKLPVDGTPPGAKCASNSVTRTPTGYAISSRCDMGTGGVTTREGTVTGDFDNAYELAMTVTTTGAALAQMNGVHKVTISSKRLGECPAGMTPGATETADGLVIDRSQYDPAKAKAIAEAAKKAGQ
jgi:hypothetical protein